MIVVFDLKVSISFRIKMHNNATGWSTDILKRGQFIIHYNICREIIIRKLILTQYDFAFNSSFISYHSLLRKLNLLLKFNGGISIKDSLFVMSRP
jgi:hypothetical protein